MTIQAGQWVKCVDASSLWGPHELLVQDCCYLVKEVHHAGDHVRIEGSFQWIKIGRFVPLDEGLSASPAKPKAPAIVLNAKAKGKAKVDAPQWVPHVTNHGTLPEGSLVYTHAEYIDVPSRTTCSPLWLTIHDKIPPKHRELIYRKLKRVFGSPETTSLKPHATRVVDAFTWVSTPDAGLWHKLNFALSTENWTYVDAYLESQSEA